MKTYDKWEGYGGWVRRLVTTRPFGFHRERWEYFCNEYRFGLFVDDKVALLLNGERLPDRYEEGFAAGKDAEARRLCLSRQQTSRLEAELDRRKMLMGQYVSPNTGAALNNATIHAKCFTDGPLDRRAGDRRKAVPTSGGKPKNKKRKR